MALEKGEISSRPFLFLCLVFEELGMDSNFKKCEPVPNFQPCYGIEFCDKLQ